MNKVKLLFVMITLIFALLFVGCSAQESNNDEGLATGDGGGNDVVVETSRKIKYTVNIVLRSTDINKDSNKIRNKAIEFGGHIEDSAINTEEESENSTGYVIYKIPTENLNSFLDFIDGEGGVKSKNIKATDITSQYNKVEARLEILESSKNAYFNLLEKATSTYELIEIKTRIEEIETEIERLKLEKSSYDDLLEYSTVTIRFNGEEDEKYLSGYWNYFIGFFKILFKIIMYVLPFALVAGVLLGGLFAFNKINKKIRKKRNS